MNLKTILSYMIILADEEASKLNLNWVNLTLGHWVITRFK
jgi:hypothetical protein